MLLNREEYNAKCLATYKFKCETDPTFRDKLNEQNRTRLLNKRMLDNEFILGVVKPGR